MKAAYLTTTGFEIRELEIPACGVLENLTSKSTDLISGKSNLIKAVILMES